MPSSRSRLVREAPGGVLAGGGKHFVVWFPPNVRTVAQAMVRLER